MRALVCAALLALAACGQSTEAPSPAPPAETPSAAWDAELLTLLPAIDACIAAGAPRMVSYAGAQDGGTFVRLRGEAPIDCRVWDGAAVVGARDEALVVAGEDAAIFVRGPGENPGGECYDAPEVRDASGAVIGWMLDPAGC